jgi:hypothetical protein
MKGMVNPKELLLKKVSRIYVPSPKADQKVSGLMSRSAVAVCMPPKADV